MKPIHRYAATALLFTALSYTADARGCFIYVSYGLAFVFTVVIFVFFFVSCRAWTLRRKFLGTFVFISSALSVSMIALPRVPTSDRKAYFLAYQEIRIGMDINEVRQKMDKFDSTPFSEYYPASLSFRFQVKNGTIDVIVVRLRDDKVVDAEYSPD